MPINIVKYQDIVCLQIPKTELLDFYYQLTLLGKTSFEVSIRPTNGTIIFKLSETDFLVDLNDLRKIRIMITALDLEDVVNSIKEYLDFESSYLFDHSFESFGAKIVPNNFKDFVIETI